MKVWVDPAEGWKYGFPRIWDQETHPDCNKWMVECGYPQHLVDEGLPVRMWPVAQEEQDD